MMRAIKSSGCLTRGRREDEKDIQVLKYQLTQYNPFDCQDSRLQSIFTGVTTDRDDGVNLRGLVLKFRATLMMLLSTKHQ